MGSSQRGPTRPDCAETGHEIYSWTALPDRKALGAGERMAFRSRLATPPPEGRDVVVRFFNRRDLVMRI